MNASVINIVYIISAILFIFGIKMLGKADTARRGNLLSSVGMLVAVLATLLDRQILGAGAAMWALIIGGIAIGSAIGWAAAKFVKMTSMPEMVALLNGFGGLASLLVGWADFQYFPNKGTPVDNLYFYKTATILAVLIGGITFTGSIYAWGKLSGKISGKAKVFAGQKLLNAFVAILCVAASAAFVFAGEYKCAHNCLIAGIALSMLLGVAAVMPIGGGDMPVVISLLNSFSGLAASAAGFVIQNNVLIVAGCLVGASGVILSVIMCKAMNRTLYNVLFSGFGAKASKAGGEIKGEMKPISADDAYFVLEAAQNVVFIPGYGMAVAQAQHAVKELAAILEEKGAEVRFAIHPVAGRMPGHMNVLLAEADVPYEQLCEMQDVNPIMENVDVAIVIGANDVVNPAAAQDKSSPIYGMPIIEAYKAKTVFCLKRGQGAGFSGLVNTLFYAPNTRMLYGDAKSTITDLVSKFKD
ncbi:MAG: NAD(P)(+) transhydrogenase (Re/Si-specific) subunit beta [Opitutales bacterium]|nr:NAD(P)(+) transhydrogenase (Re/Si-specific) subunit beta [Opitutales bacterium]